MTRRALLLSSAAALGSAALAGCDNLGYRPWFRNFLGKTEDLTKAAQRTVVRPTTLAREFTEADLSPGVKSNGTHNPREAEYQALAAGNFADWKLAVGGLVERPRDYSLADLRALPAREQITRHDCVEGWSAIGKWKGPQLSTILEEVGVKPEAKYVVFYCYDGLGTVPLNGSNLYYESIDMEDAYHPQTILAYELNGETLPIPNGAPLRVRVERQLGYKMAKYLKSIALVESFDDIFGGMGGYWEDRGYEWYGGI
jgi:DMSO/TMAO reductase YedYZ molybdopterin-dependent catalytic subunit